MSKSMPIPDLLMMTPRPSKNIPARRTDNDVKRQFTPLSYRYNKNGLDDDSRNAVVDHGGEPAEDAEGILACTKNTARSLAPAITMSRQKDVDRRCGNSAAAPVKVATTCSPVTIWSGSVKRASTGADTIRPDIHDGIDGSRSSCTTQTPSQPGMLFSGGSSASLSGVQGQGSSAGLKARPVVVAAPRASSPRSDVTSDSLLRRCRSAASPSPASKRHVYSTVAPSPARASTRSPVRHFTAMEGAISPRAPFVTATPVTATPLTAECERSQLNQSLAAENQLRASMPCLPRAEPMLQRHQSLTNFGMQRQSSLTELQKPLMVRAEVPSRQSSSVQHSSPRVSVTSPVKTPAGPRMSAPGTSSVEVQPCIPQVMAQPLSPRRSSMGSRQRSQEFVGVKTPGTPRFSDQAPRLQPAAHQLEEDANARQIVHQQLQQKIEQLQMLQNILVNQQDQLVQQQGCSDLRANQQRNAELDQLQQQLHQEHRVQQEFQHQLQQRQMLQRPQERQPFGSYTPRTLGDDHGLKPFESDGPGSGRARSNSANARRRRFLV